MNENLLTVAERQEHFMKGAERLYISSYTTEKRELRTLNNAMINAALAEYCRVTFYDNEIVENTETSENKLIIKAAELFLAQKYPHVDLRTDPAIQMLYGAFTAETRVVINELIREDTNAYNERDLAADELLLSKQYPHLDLSEDPSREMLEGVYKEEVEKVLDDLVS